MITVLFIIPARINALVTLATESSRAACMARESKVRCFMRSFGDVISKHVNSDDTVPLLFMQERLISAVYLDYYKYTRSHNCYCDTNHDSHMQSW